MSIMQISHKVFKADKVWFSMKYLPAPDVADMAIPIIDVLGMKWIRKERLFFARSVGSQSRTIIARCHSMGRVWKAAGIPITYLIEVVSERYDKLPEDEKVKTIIHELLHIPKSFGGGFRHHDYVSDARVDMLYKRFVEKRTGMC